MLLTKFSFLLLLIFLFSSFQHHLNAQYPVVAGGGAASGGAIGPSGASYLTQGGTLDKYNSDTLAYKDKIQVMMFVPFVAQSSGYRQPSMYGGNAYGSYGYPYGGGYYGSSPYYYQPGSNYQSVQTPGGVAYSSNYGYPSYGNVANGGAYRY
ncbi:predicted protein [Naegleria gruberi]|uniref:Predicted protein n=1 Tax=Naegleria gruberi TaxID=5762 RepID=D2VB84_NAEGR|nr:uncharacterized protein NAEGRDRAFT_66126 [Naegleria gruberi]EFC45865.1 predicted protein [Naegleria gruberi]|eukprot:XP_002678609.1 predicted protein [Naegleria gruberi strain NEG-M]